jgi:prephenate dehydrogenase
MKEEPFSLASAKIAILGLGLMGGSLALALRGKCAALFGIDPDPATLELARRQNIVDQAEADPAKLLPQADLIILAAPVPGILHLLKELPALMPHPCLVMDIGSTKAAIVQAMEDLPPRFDPLGGHPICGKEKLSLAHAERTLYYGAPFLLTPLPRTSPRALSAASQLIETLGARETRLSAAEHDRILASTSHLPFLLSCALALATPAAVAPFVGPGYRSASRLADTPASMMLGVLQTNRQNLIPALEALQDELALLTDALIQDDSETLQASLLAAQARYRQLVGG